MPSQTSMAAALGLGGVLVASRMSATFTAPATQRDGAIEVSRGVSSLRGSVPSSSASSSVAVAGLVCSGVCAVAATATSTRSKRAARVTVNAVREAPAVIAGTGGPLPESFWDPAGLTKGKTDEELLQLRAAELKHGRVAMLAFFGWLTHASGYHYLGDLWLKGKCSDNPLEAFTQLSMLGVWQMVFFIACLEWLTLVPCPPPKEAPWDVLGMCDVLEEDTPENPRAGYNNLKMQELNNGRLAMIGITGLILQTMATGDYGGDLDIINPGWLKYTAIPDVPFKPPQLYPGQVWFQFQLPIPTITDFYLYNPNV